MPKKQTEWTRAYNEKAYDRLAVTIPKGRKAMVEEHAQRKGLSINGLVNALLRTELDLAEEDWKHTPED